MKTFNYISREYVPSIDLNTLGKTYDTLEQGHKEAVKTASDLEVTMANLDLNEAESEWRQQKINEIKETVAENTIYGNSYAALDDIIAKAGNLASDQGTIGRLQAQKDYKAFRERVENDKTLPQDYKDYYLQHKDNQYKYEDVYDNNGDIIGGTKWTPGTSPTAVVPLSQLVVQGISIAAKESGGGTMTRWIDSNGNVTPDPTKAFDGEVYNSTTNSWERLSREKIWQGINSMIASTPGALESIKQDYNVARWRHDKAVKTNDGKPFESDVTDANGVYLSEEDYLRKRVDPAVQAASYYNSTSKTTYGNGLATYKAAQAKATAAAEAQQLSMTNAAMSGRNTPVEVKVDAAAEFVSTKNITEKSIKDLYKRLTGHNLYIKPDTQIGNLDSLLDKYNVPVADRQQIRANVRAYNEAQSNLTAYTANMSDKDRKDFLFAARIKSGGQLISSANGGSQYDDKLINYTNSLYGKNGQTAVITLSDKTLQNVDNIINGGEYEGYSKLGIRREGNKIIIPKSAMYSLPMVASIIEKAETRANKGIWASLYQIGTNNRGRFSVDVLDANDNSIYGDNTIIRNGGTVPTITTGTEVYGDLNRSTIRRIAGVYNNGVEQTNKLSNKYKVAPTTITVSSLNLDGKHFTDGTLLDQYNKGLISHEQYNTYKKYFDDSFDDIIRGVDFSQTQMYMSDETGTRKIIEDSGERFNYGSEILQAVKDKRVTFSPTIVPGSYDPISGAPIAGYNITVLQKVDSKGNVVKGEKQKRFYIPGMINETASKFMMQDPYVQAFNAVAVTGSTKSTRILADENSNPRLGKVSITGFGNDMYSTQFGGITRTVTTEDAVKLATAINNYNACKNTFLASGESELNSRIRSTLVNSATAISEVYGLKPEAVLDRFIEDINK